MPTAETNGIEIYYEEYGERGAGPSIVVAHGALDDHRVWAERLRPLADERHVVVYDHRGHGHSERPTQDAYTVETYAADLARLIDTLSLDRPVVLGHSLGGMVGYEFAATYPDRLSGLVTMGSATPRTFSFGERLYRDLFPRLITPVIANERVSDGVYWLQEQVFGEDATVELDEVERIRERHDCPDRGDIEAADRGRVFAGVVRYMDSTLDLAAIDVPTLVMFAEREPIPDQHGTYLQVQIGDCEVREIPEATHNAQVDNPEFVREALRAFVESRVRAGAAPTPERG